MKRQILVCASLVLTGTLGAQAQSMPALTGAKCPDSYCETVLKQLIEESIPQAKRREYQGMRDVAYCQWTGCDGAVVVNRSSSCAWRRMIMITGRADPGDEANLSTCRRNGY